MIQNKKMQSLRDQLLGALIGLARATDVDAKPDRTTGILVADGLALYVSEAPERQKYSEMIQRIHAEKFRLMPDCAVCDAPCGRVADYDWTQVKGQSGELSALKYLLHMGLEHIVAEGKEEEWDESHIEFFLNVLFALGEEWDSQYFLPIMTATGKYIMEFLH